MNGPYSMRRGETFKSIGLLVLPPGKFLRPILKGDGLLAWHPFWPAFALNTCFYALLTWPLIRVPLALRRWRRRRAGRCIACGYDLKGLAEGAPCPECGSGRTPARS